MQARQSLELRQQQQLAMTPQLQQAIRFLQLSTQELEVEVAQALSENPLLEHEEEYDIDASSAVAANAPNSDDRWLNVSGTGRGATSNQDEPVERPESAVPVTLQDHLLEQLRLTRAGPRDCALVTVLIGELDDHGYLASGLDEIADILPAELDVQPDELQAALRLLQSFDPPGVGASKLSECLLLQLDRLPLAQEQNAVWRCARSIALDHLELLATGNMNRLREALDCDMRTLRDAHRLLLSLEPRPAREWGGALADYVTPDIIVERHAKGWVPRINPAVMPRLRVNPLYEQWVQQAAASSMQGQLQQAQGLIRSVNQRFVTILRVAQAVVRHQQGFFEDGPVALRPLVLRDIAQELGMHESTVSRATKGKYAQTPWGVMELKGFFGASLQTEDGTATSAAAVRTLIQELIAQESPRKPLSDSRVAALLAERGVVIARRTVAKYREAAGIEPAIMRKARALSGA